jgi:teichuronic acid biosynthesis glycosyltransferase TuaC
MKVLFVCSGNNKSFKIAPFIKEQGESLKLQGIEVDYFTIFGKGWSGYLKAVVHLRRHLKKQSYDLIHAHYTLSGWTAIMGAGRIPVVLSLMGDDACGTYVGINRIRFKSRIATLLTKLIQPFVKAIISKSPNIEKHVYIKKKSYLIPNGIDIGKFMPNYIPEPTDLMVKNGKKKVLFLGNKTNTGKNFPLAQAALEKLNIPDVEMVSPYPVPHHRIPGYLNSANVLVFPSLHEGSPNVIKEAMACNCPIVSTDVGDVRWVLGETKGCYIASFDVKEFAEKIRLALEFAEQNGRTNGKQRIVDLGLDSETIAKRIIEIYRKVLMKTV